MTKFVIQIAEGRLQFIAKHFNLIVYVRYGRFAIFPPPLYESDNLPLHRNIRGGGRGGVKGRNQKPPVYLV